MDPELIAYLDRNFSELRHETTALRQETTTLRQETTTLRQETTALRQELSSFRQETEHRFENVETQIRENRVVIEDLYSKVQTVAEGFVNVSESLERFRGEANKEFADVRSEMRSHGRQSYSSLDVRVSALEKVRTGH